MKLIKNVTSGMLLGAGLIMVLAGLYAPFNSKISRQERFEQLIACMIFGVPVTAWGALMRRGLNGDKPTKAEQLRALFFKLLQENEGRITVLRFAMESGLAGDQARTYLDERAKEFDATFEVDESGGVIYCFRLGSEA